MSLPSIEVYASLQRVVVNVDTFILDDASKGLLDTNKLGGFSDTLVDVPILSLSVNRGRSRQLDRFTAGTATIIFDNRGRELDPLNTGSSFQDLIVPRVLLKIYADGIPLFFGFVTDWDIQYDPLGNDKAVAYLADAFSVLSGLTFDADVTPVSELPGERLQWVLDELQYSGLTDFDVGLSTLGAYQISEGTQALDYMFRVQKSDRGFLFTSSDGVVTYVNRFGRDNSESVVFSDDGLLMPYQSLNAEYGDDLLFNRVILSSPAGTVAEEDSDSISDFGVSGLVWSDLLNSSVLDLSELASSYVVGFADPKVRFTGVSVELAGLSVDRVEQLLRLELASEVVLLKSFDVGAPSVVSQSLVVSGVRHRVRPGSHVMEFSFEDSPFGDFFKLDDAQFGILDLNILG